MKKRVRPSASSGQTNGGGATRARTFAFLALGLAGVGALLYYVGFAEVMGLLLSLGWSAPLILVPYAAIMSFDVLGWSRALATPIRRGISFWRLFWIRLAGEAVNNLTPTAGFGGEPVKAYLLRQQGIEAGAGVASVVIAKGALISTQIVFTLVGLVLFLDWLELLRDRAWMLALGWLIGLALVVVIVAGQRRHLVQRAVRALRYVGLRGSFLGRLERRAVDIDESLIRFYRDDPRGFLAATTYHMIGWFIGVTEVVLFLWLMGLRCGWREALILESVTQALMVSGAIIPGGLGVQELSGAVLCRILGIGEAGGVALMLLKRARELAFSLAGLVALSFLARQPR